MTPAELAALQAYNNQQRQERKDAALKGYGLGLAAGAAGVGAAGLAVLSPAQRAKLGQGLLGRLDQAKKAVQEFRAERPAGVNQGNIPVTPENIEKAKKAGTRAPLNVQAERAASPEIQAVAQTQPAISEKQRVFEDVVKRRPLDAPDPELRRPEETGYRSQALAEYERANPPSEAVKEARRQEAYVPRSYLEEQGFVPGNTMVDQQDARLGLQVDQSVAAVNSAEDQATGRVMHRLQANEDLDIGAVNAAKEQVEAQLAETVAQNPEIAGAVRLDAAANEVARSLPDGLPVDQAEKITRLPQAGPASTSAADVERYVASFSDESPTVRLEEPAGTSFLKDYQRERGLSRLQEIQARASLDPRTAKTGIPAGPEGTRVRQALDLYASTGDPAVLSLLDEAASLPLTVSPEGAQSIVPGKAGVVRTGELYKPFAKQEMGVRYEPGTKTVYEPGYTAPINEAERQFQISEEAKLRDFPDKYRVQRMEEGSRLFFQQDPGTGKPIPETIEFRQERPSVDIGTRGGGGRNIAEFSAGAREDEPVRTVRSGGRNVRMRDYDVESLGGEPAQSFQPDRSQTGREIDIYGIRPSAEAPADPEVRPSKPGASRTPLTQEPTEAGRRSIDASQKIKQIQATNPPEKAQLLINDFLKSLKGN